MAAMTASSSAPPTDSTSVPTLELLKERFGEVPEVRGDVYKSNAMLGVFGIQHARDVLGYEPQYTCRDFGTR